MLFTEPRFLVFFVVVAAVHWALRSNGLRKAWLLAASYVFYGAWDWRFLSLIAISTLVDWTVGLRLRRTLRAGSWQLTPLLAIERLFDTTDSLIFGYPEPGRLLRFELAARPSWSKR